MLGVTQFEVYALAKGRWTLHARYAGHDQNEALWDARTTEASTGFPTKIVRETFFPELNDSERITTYISPNAKKAAKGQPVGTAPQQRPAPQARARQTAQQPRRLTAPQMMLRVVVAAAFSVLAAAVMAGVIKYVLSTFADIGIQISPAASSTIMTYSWVVMFLLFFFSLFRSRLPLHRILADMWHASAKPAAAVAAKVKPIKLKLKPKHDRGPTSPETLREWQDLRVRRGDPDIFTAPIDMAPDLPMVDGAGLEVFKEVPRSKPAAERKAEPAEKAAQEKKTPEKGSEKGSEKPVEKTAAEKPKQAPEKQDRAAEGKAVQERIAKAKEKAAHETAAAEKAAREHAPLTAGLTDDTAAVAPPPVLDDEDDFAHSALRAFIADVVKPAAAAAMRDDPVARRGMALAVAGAVEGIKTRPDAIALDAPALLAWGLIRTGMNETVADLFMQSHDAYVSQPANQSLVASGQGLMTDMIPLQSPDPAPFVSALSAAFAAWRTPFGQPGLLVDTPDGTTETPFATPNERGRTGGLVDAFLLTEMRPLSRHDDPLQDDARIAGHNERVRAALTNGGTEIKHTGKGIFARFTDAGAAVATAKNLQRELGSAIAIAVIGNTDTAEDPVLSPTLFLRAEAAMGSTGDGQIAVEAHVTGEDQRIGQPTDLVILPPPAAETGEVLVA